MRAKGVSFGQRINDVYTDEFGNLDEETLQSDLRRLKPLLEKLVGENPPKGLTCLHAAMIWRNRFGRLLILMGYSKQFNPGVYDPLEDWSSRYLAIDSGGYQLWPANKRFSTREDITLLEIRSCLERCKLSPEDDRFESVFAVINPKCDAQVAEDNAREQLKEQRREAAEAARLKEYIQQRDKAAQQRESKIQAAMKARQLEQNEVEQQAQLSKDPRCQDQRVEKFIKARNKALMGKMFRVWHDVTKENQALRRSEHKWLTQDLLTQASTGGEICQAIVDRLKNIFTQYEPRYCMPCRFAMGLFDRGERHVGFKNAEISITVPAALLGVVNCLFGDNVAKTSVEKLAFSDLMFDPNIALPSTHVARVLVAKMKACIIAYKLLTKSYSNRVDDINGLLREHYKTYRNLKVQDVGELIDLIYAAACQENKVVYDKVKSPSTVFSNIAYYSENGRFDTVLHETVLS